MRKHEASYYVNNSEKAHEFLPLPQPATRQYSC
jgi:hypothetical protein